MIPPVSKQDTADIQKNAGDCSRFFYRLFFSRPDHFCHRFRATISLLAANACLYSTLILRCNIVSKNFIDGRINLVILANYCSYNKIQILGYFRIFNLSTHFPNTPHTLFGILNHATSMTTIYQAQCREHRSSFLMRFGAMTRIFRQLF